MKHVLWMTVLVVTILVGGSCQKIYHKPEPFFYDFSIISQQIPRLVAPGSVVKFPVLLANLGWGTWPKGYAVSLAYHWRKLNGEMLDYDGIRTAIPHTVLPGYMVDIMMEVRFPDVPGEYLLQADMVHEGITWFSRAGTETPDFKVTVVDLEQ